MKRMMKGIAAATLSLWVWLAHAQALETLNLRYRTAEQIIPDLRPMLAPGAALTGKGELLFIRTTAANLDEIRQLIAVLDRPVRRLLISVRQGGQQTYDQGGVAVSGEYSSGNTRIITSGNVPGAGGQVVIQQGGNIVQGQAADTRSTRRENVSQQVQTIEGGRALINVGQSLPLPMRQIVPTPYGATISDTVVYRDVGSGFYAEPRLSGDQVSLEITTAHDTQGRAYGSTDVQRISTTVSGRFGEWISLGGSQQQTDHQQRGMAAYSSSGRSDDRQVWLKVEALD